MTCDYYRKSGISPPDYKQQMEKLVMDITSRDLNLQMQQLIADYKKTGDERFKTDADYLRSEFDEWWNSDDASFVPPAQL